MFISQGIAKNINLKRERVKKNNGKCKKRGKIEEDQGLLETLKVQIEMEPQILRILFYLFNPKISKNKQILRKKL